MRLIEAYIELLRELQVLGDRPEGVRGDIEERMGRGLRYALLTTGLQAVAAFSAFDTYTRLPTADPLRILCAITCLALPVLVWVQLQDRRKWEQLDAKVRAENPERRDGRRRRVMTLFVVSFLGSLTILVACTVARA